jgi:hypothetical protein
MSVLPCASAPSPQPNVLYETVSIALGAALVATTLLRYMGPRLHANTRDVMLQFDDPLGNGPELARRYAAGVFPAVNPRLLTDAHKFLQEEVRRVKGPADAR